MSISFDDHIAIERLRKTRREKMQEIIPRLWLGSQEALFDDDLLERHDISHIVTVMPTFINEQGVTSTQLASEVHQFCDSGIFRLIIPVEDSSTENLLQYFPRATEFILAALCNGGHVLVHCLAGASRSPTVVAAFLMEVFRLSPTQAIEKIRLSRPLIRPILGFFDQLQVYEACEYRPSNQPIYIHWKLRAQCETEIERPRNTAVLPHAKILAKIPNPIPYVVIETPRLTCASCNKDLAPQAFVLPRTAGVIDDYFLAQPIDWMSPEFDNREHEGSLACTRCENVVGEYNWNGRRNMIGDWVSPAFVLYRKMVVETCWKT